MNARAGFELERSKVLFINKSVINKEKIDSVL